MIGFKGLLLARYLSRGSHNREILKGFFWIFLFVFLAKIAGAAKEIAIAWRYGTSIKTDSYIFVFNLVTWPVAIWFSVLTVVLVPLNVEMQSKDLRVAAKFQAELLGMTLILGMGAGFLSVPILNFVLAADWLQLSSGMRAEALRLVNWLALLIPLGTIISLFSARMLALGRHQNTLLEAVPAIVLLIALLLPHSWLSEPLIWGSIVGFLAHLFSLGVPLRRRGELPVPNFSFSSPMWPVFWSGIGIMVVGQILLSFTSIIDQFFAASLGPGALSTLGYANRILALISGMIAMAISRSILPVLSNAITQGAEDVNRLALRWAKWMFFIGIGLVVVVWTASSWIVSILFERGQFNAEDTTRVADVLKFSVIQMPFFIFSLTLSNLMASKKQYSMLLFSGVFGFVLKAASSAILIPTFGILGVPLSSAVLYLGNSLMFYFYVIYSDRIR